VGRPTRMTGEAPVLQNAGDIDFKCQCERMRINVGPAPSPAMVMSGYGGIQNKKTLALEGVRPAEVGAIAVGRVAGVLRQQMAEPQANRVVEDALILAARDPASQQGML
jgi:hypothetical protein